MKTRLIPLLCCIFLSGCYVQSLNRFYSDDLKVKLPQIEGEWITKIQLGNDVSNKKINPWKFTEDIIESYDSENNYSQFEVAYFKIGKNYYVDCTAGEPSKDNKCRPNAYWGIGVIQVHSLCKVLLDGDNLTIIPLDLEWFINRIKKKELELSYIKPDKDSNYIFTASTEEWIRFLKKYGDDPKVFNAKYKFVFSRDYSPTRE